MPKHPPALKVGDEVTVRVQLCEFDGMQGTVVGIDETLPMPILVQLSNWHRSSFEASEFESHMEAGE